MRKKLSVLCLLALMLSTACGRITLDDQKVVALQPITVQGREFRAVFPDASGVTDYAMGEQGQLAYVEDKVLWKTSFDGLHKVERGSGYEEWYSQIAETNSRLRSASDQPPRGFISIAGENIRFSEYNRLVAYRQPEADGYDLVICTPDGQKRVVLSGVKELSLLGWADDMNLVFAAKGAGIMANVYVVDLRPDYVELIDYQVSTFSPDVHALTPWAPGPGLKSIWEYDAERIAYQLGSKVYLRELASGSQRELADVGRDDVIWGEHELFVSSHGDAATSILWLQGEAQQLSGNSGFVADLAGGKLYYMSHPSGRNRIYAFDLVSQQETQLAEASPETSITCFALSPDGKRLLFVDAAENNHNPGEQVPESLFILDLVNGDKREVSGLTKGAQIRHEQVVWMKENLIALGYCGLMAPQEAQTLSFYTLSNGSLSVKREPYFNSGLFTPSGKGVFLSDRDYSDGYAEEFKANVWYYDVEQDSLRQLTSKAEWQIQQDDALAYNPERGLLFISRFKGSTQADYSGRVLHGVLIDWRGREYTLQQMRDEEILRAFWVGNRLLVWTTGSVAVYEFSE